MKVSGQLHAPVAEKRKDEERKREPLVIREWHVHLWNEGILHCNSLFAHTTGLLSSTKIHKKVNLSLSSTKYYAMNTYPGSGGITPRVLNLGARWRLVVSFTSRPLHPLGKNARYPFDWRLGGPQSRCGRGVEKKIPASAGNIEHQSSSP